MLTLREKHAYEHEIAGLKAELSIMKSSLIDAEAVNSALRIHKSKIGKGTLSDRARATIRLSQLHGYEGSITDECRRISKLIGITWKYVAQLWYEEASIENGGLN